MAAGGSARPARAGAAGRRTRSTVCVRPFVPLYCRLERCLADDIMPLGVRVAGALIMLYGIHIGQVVALHRDDVIEEDGNVLIALAGSRLIIPPRLARLLVQLPRPSSSRRSRRRRP